MPYTSHSLSVLTMSAQRYQQKYILVRGMCKVLTLILLK